MKKVIALVLSAAFLVIMLAGCNGDSSSGTDTEGSQNGVVNGGGEQSPDEPPRFVAPEYNLPDKEADVIRPCTCGGGHDRKIIVATFWDMYYDSTHTDVFDNPNVVNPETAQMVLDRVRYVEDKYNFCVEYKNITWEGMIESIPVSVMSGIPDADVYMGDTQFIIPAVLNNMATAIEDMDIEPEFLADLMADGGNNIVMECVQIPGQDKTYLFKEARIEVNMYWLGYNRDMIQAKGLEDPQDLWYRGEWTWDAFREHCRVLTDTTQDIYGWSGYWTNLLTGLLFSNDAAFAAGPTQTVDDPKTLEVLNLIYDLYNVDKSARPWNMDDWVINNSLFAEGKSGFWITSQWIVDEQFNAKGFDAITAPFDYGMVPFPVGPSGNAETMKTTNVSGNYFFIPRYIKDPGDVFNFMYDLSNWFEGDLEYRDDIDWFYDRLLTPENTDLYMSMIGRVGFDLWDSLGVDASIPYLLETVGGENPGPAQYRPAQYAETYRQVYQDALDNYFK